MNRGRPQSQRPDNPLYAAFKETFAFYLPPALRGFLTAEDLDRFLRGRYDFFRVRKERASVRLSNPDGDQLLYINSTLIEAALPDSPFLLDTLIEFCQSSDLRIDMLISPVLAAERDEQGLLRHCGFSDRGGAQETLIYLQTARLPENRLPGLQRELSALFEEVQCVVDDYARMRAELETCLADRNAAQWFADHLILLGSAPGRGQPGEALGLLRNAELRKASMAQTPMTAKATGLSFHETTLLSRVNHRRPLTLALSSDRSRVFLVHFAQSADLSPRNEMPQIAEALEQIAEELRAGPRSHLRKQLYSFAQHLPASILYTRLPLLREWLPMPLENLHSDSLERNWVLDEQHSMLWLSIALPVREAQRIPDEPLAALQQELGYAIVHRLEQEFFRNRWMLFGLRSLRGSPDALRKALDQRERHLFLSWREELRRIVRNRLIGDEAINAAMIRFFAGLSPEQELHCTPEEAFQDLSLLDELSEQDDLKVRLLLDDPERAAVKVYSARPLLLGEVTPALSSAGLVLREQITIPFQHSAGLRFTLRFALANPPALQRHERERVEETLEWALNNRTPCDALNALALRSALSAREIDLVRALAACFFQLEKAFARITLLAFLANNAAFTEALVGVFAARFGGKTDAKHQKQRESDLQANIEKAATARDEQLMVQLSALVQAIVRTNFFLNRDEISFKIHSQRLSFAPPPAPLFEIFVYCADFEGVHLRSEMVARGGIRWSDRPDDFRTEVLGLMKAQMVKNTLIVPGGSKGGFVLKKAPRDRKEMQQAGVAAYQRYANALLELTDTIAADGKVIPANGIIRLDADDPYLVVAADKGTATFSDLANEVSQRRGFWLDDAFASGGQNGYDHKKQGITARGAWESVRRHCLELDLDPEKDPITVVGIGDMSGDVFGNGMLLSRSLKLIAAFNHLYVFIDPNPDPETSFAERKRLFDGAQNWNHYDTAKISKGGGVFDRGARRIALSPEVRHALGTKASALSGEELIRAALRAPVDLVWNGGIGCYVKASTEQHFQARDSANDRVRVDATELRCKVIGEGGNLGLTQAARVEAAARGVRLNTDAMDNSAGVNMSDHEVNLKILLQGRMARGNIKSLEERNQLIRRLENEEIELVLASNRANNLALSVDQRRGGADFIWIRTLVKELNREGYIDRQQDTIPFEADMDRLQRERRTLPRPTLCSLFGFAKLRLRHKLLAEEAFTDDQHDDLALRYFPPQLAKNAGDDILNHPLKRQIVIAEALNYIFNRMGLSYVMRIEATLGVGARQIVESFLLLSDFIDLESLWDRFPTDGRRISTVAYYDFLIELQNQVRDLHLRLLSSERGAALLDAKGRSAFQKLLLECEEHGSFRPPRELRASMRALGDGAPGALAALRRIFALSDAFTIYLAVREKPRRWTAADYHRALDAFEIGDLRRLASSVLGAGEWESRFSGRLQSEIDRLLIDLLDLGLRHTATEPRARALTLLAEQAQEMFAAQSLSPVALYEIVQQMRSSIN